MNARPTFNTEPMVIGTNAVAEMLGMCAGTFRNKRTELEALGFPAKLPGLAKYSAPAVRRWIETNGETTQPDDSELVDLAAALEAEYAGEAA